MALSITFLKEGTFGASLMGNTLFAVVIVKIRAATLVPVVAHDVVGGALSAVTGVIVALIAFVRASSAL